MSPAHCKVATQISDGHELDIKGAGWTGAVESERDALQAVDSADRVVGWTHE